MNEKVVQSSTPFRLLLQTCHFCCQPIPARIREISAYQLLASSLLFLPFNPQAFSHCALVSTDKSLRFKLAPSSFPLSSFSALNLTRASKVLT